MREARPRYQTYVPTSYDPNVKPSRQNNLSLKHHLRPAGILRQSYWSLSWPFKCQAILICNKRKTSIYLGMIKRTGILLWYRRQDIHFEWLVGSVTSKQCAPHGAREDHEV